MTSYWWKSNHLYFLKQLEPFSLFVSVYFLFPQACGPQYGYMCGQQQYISGVCANVSSSFQILNSVAPAVQGTQPDEMRLIRSTREFLGGDERL